MTAVATDHLEHFPRLGRAEHRARQGHSGPDRDWNSEHQQHGGECANSNHWGGCRSRYTVFVTVGMDAGTQTVTISDNATGGTYLHGRCRRDERQRHDRCPHPRLLRARNPRLDEQQHDYYQRRWRCQHGRHVLLLHWPCVAVTKDKFSTNSGNSTTPASGTTTATSQADELLLGAVTYESSRDNLTSHRKY